MSGLSSQSQSEHAFASLRAWSAVPMDGPLVSGIVPDEMTLASVMKAVDVGLRFVALPLVVAAEVYLLANLAYLVLTLLGAVLGRAWPRALPAPQTGVPGCFAILIAARNEERVVGDAVRSARDQDFRGSLRVVVVADNCSDGTAEAARLAGAEVYERRTGGPSTKGQALAWLWAHLERRTEIDVVAVLDADNLAAPDFVWMMERELSRGFRAAQGLRASRNPDVGHAGRLDGLAEALNQRVEGAGRRWWGLSGPLSGSGMAFEAEVFDFLITRGAHTMVEDLEWQLELLGRGVEVHWAPSAVVYDEKVADFADLRVQRSRWIRGKVDLVREHFGRLISGALRGHKGAAEGLLVLLAVLPRSVLGSGLVAGGALAVAAPWIPGLLAWPVWALALGSLAAYSVAGVALVGPDRTFWRTLPHAPRFLLALLLSFLLALRRRTPWVSTPHYGSERPRPGPFR